MKTTSGHTVIAIALAFVSTIVRAQSGPDAGSGIPGTVTTNTLVKGSSGTLADSTLLDDGTTVAVNTNTTFRRAVGSTSFTGSNFLTIAGTLPSTVTNEAFGVAMPIVGAGSSGAGKPIGATFSWLQAGYTGSSTTSGFWGLNSSAGIAAGPNGTDTTALGNIGVFGQTSSTTAGGNTGVLGYSSNGSGTAVGVLGSADSGATTYGVFGIVNGGTTRVGGAFTLSQVTTAIASGILVNNGSQAVPIAVFKDADAALPATGATATVAIQDGAILQVGTAALTSATMTAENMAQVRGVWHSYTWTNAQVAALSGAADDIPVATLPAKTVVTNAYVVITGAAVGPTTVTVACGRTSASFIDYIVASDAKAAANTVYGDASGERGTNLTGYDLPSYTGTTTVTCHFISTGANLSTVTGSTGRVILETALLP